MKKVMEGIIKNIPLIFLAITIVSFIAFFVCLATNDSYKEVGNARIEVEIAEETIDNISVKQIEVCTTTKLENGDFRTSCGMEDVEELTVAYQNKNKALEKLKLAEEKYRHEHSSKYPTIFFWVAVLSIVLSGLTYPIHMFMEDHERL